MSHSLTVIYSERIAIIKKKDIQKILKSNKMILEIAIEFKFIYLYILILFLKF
jgi:hypothetical protein